MAAVRELIIDITDPECKGLLREFGSPVKARPPIVGRGDSGPRRIRLVEPTGLDRRSFKDADTTSYAIEYAAGPLDAAPTGGTYTITRNSLASASIAYNASAATVETALEGISGFPGTGCTVTKYGSNAYEIRFNANGAQAYPLVAGTNLLEPDCGIYLTIMQTGDGSTPTIVWLRLLQKTVAYQSTWTAYPTGSASVTTLIAGTATKKEVVRISLDEPAYDGSLLVTMGTVEKYNITVTQNNAADALDNFGFIIFDTNGSVGVYFDGTPDASITACDRQINVNTLTTGDSKATVASKLATALTSDSEFVAVANGNAVKVTLETAGDVEDPVDVDSTFTFASIQQGTSITNSVPISASARDFAAALDNVVTVTKSGLFTWDLKFRDYGDQATIDVDASALFPSGYEGDINYLTRQCFRLFQETDEPSISIYEEISLTPPGKGPFTVYHAPLTVVRDIITTEQQASETLPSYYTTAEIIAGFVAKVTTGLTGTALSIDTDAGIGTDPILLITDDNSFAGDFFRIEQPSGTTVYALSQLGTLFAKGGIYSGTSANQVIPSYRVAKTSDTVRTSTTLPSADPTLVIPIAANEKWQFEFHLFVIGESATPNWKGGLTFPSSPTAVKWSMTTVDVDNLALVVGGIFSGDSTTNTAVVDSSLGVEIILRGFIQNGANAGNISVLWSQNTSSADDMTVQKCSYGIANLVP